MAKPAKALVICVKNDGYDVSLERRKLYVSIADPVAEKHGQLRVVDESVRTIYILEGSSSLLSYRSQYVGPCCWRPNPAVNTDAPQAGRRLPCSLGARHTLRVNAPDGIADIRIYRVVNR